MKKIQKLIFMPEFHIFLCALMGLICAMNDRLDLYFMTLFFLVLWDFILLINAMNEWRHKHANR